MFVTNFSRKKIVPPRYPITYPCNSHVPVSVGLPIRLRFPPAHIHPEKSQSSRILQHNLPTHLYMGRVSSCVPILRRARTLWTACATTSVVPVARCDASCARNAQLTDILAAFRQSVCLARQPAGSVSLRRAGPHIETDGEEDIRQAREHGVTGPKAGRMHVAGGLSPRSGRHHAAR